MREKLSLPIGIRGPSGSAKAPPAARSDNALRKERGGRRTRIRAEPPARALCGGREKSTHGHCAEKGSRAPRRAVFFVFHSLALRRRLSSPRADTERGVRRPSRGAGGRSRPAALLSSPMPIPPKRRAPTFPRSGGSFPPPASLLSSPHADPAKEARADLPAGRAVVHASRGVPGRTKKRSRSSVFLLSVYSLEPVSISEPMIIFWKIANRMMTGRTHMTAAAMTGPWF